MALVQKRATFLCYTLSVAFSTVTVHKHIRVLNVTEELANSKVLVKSMIHSVFTMFHAMTSYPLSIRVLYDKLVQDEKEYNF